METKIIKLNKIFEVYYDVKSFIFMSYYDKFNYYFLFQFKPGTMPDAADLLLLDGFII